jgi:hypothetical protein
MKRSDINPGSYYLMNHSSGLIPVRIEHELDRIHTGTHQRLTTYWLATNLKTGRIIEVKSAARLRRPLTPEEIDPKPPPPIKTYASNDEALDTLPDWDGRIRD